MCNIGDVAFIAGPTSRVTEVSSRAQLTAVAGNSRREPRAVSVCSFQPRVPAAADILNISSIHCSSVPPATMVGRRDSPPLPAPLIAAALST
jgi:hypothetical protein